MLQTHAEHRTTHTTGAASSAKVDERCRDPVQTHGIEQLVPMLADERPLPADELEIRVIGSALAAVFVVVDVWRSGGGRSDLLELLDQAIDKLAKGHASSG